jgi:hypothetical protein
MMAAQRDYAGAENELRDVLTRRQPRIPDHPDTLAARHELARLLASKGNASEALAEFKEVLTAKVRILGPDHLSTALTAHEIELLAAVKTPQRTSMPALKRNRVTGFERVTSTAAS